MSVKQDNSNFTSLDNSYKFTIVAIIHFSLNKNLNQAEHDNQFPAATPEGEQNFFTV